MNTFTRTAEKFHSRYKKNDESGCWEWVAGKGHFGYGSMRIGPKNYQAHRVSMFVHGHMELDNPLWVLHRCDNPSCVNPEHLFLGTPKDNSDDMVAKKRSTAGKPRLSAVAAGSYDNLRKLAVEDVKWVVFMDRAGLATQKELGRQLGVSKNAIYSIVSGDSWSHVTGIPCARHRQAKELQGG